MGVGWGGKEEHFWVWLGIERALASQRASERECCGCEVTGSGRGRPKGGGKEEHLGVVCLLCDWNEVVEVPTHRVSWRAFLLQASPRLLMLATCTNYSQLFHIPCHRWRRETGFHCLLFTFAGCNWTRFGYSVNPLRASCKSRTQPTTKKQWRGSLPLRTS